MNLLALLIFAGLLAPVKQAPQPTTDCTAVTWWFADASARVGSRKQIESLPQLAIFGATAQTVKVTARGETFANPTSFA